MTTQIVVTSSSHLPRPRAGVSFVGAMTFPVDHFSAEQLQDIMSDRLLTVVVGRVLTPADVESFTEFVAEQAERRPADLHPTPEPAPAPAATTEMVSGLSTYPAGSQAAVLPAPGEVVVDPETAGGTVDQTVHVPPVVAVTEPAAAQHHGRGHKRG